MPHHNLTHVRAYLGEKDVDVARGADEGADDAALPRELAQSEAVELQHVDRVAEEAVLLL